MVKPITLFTWGYWGWGNATHQLLQAVNAEEAARGFQPPLFVDIRISRSVRAAGFNGAAFERTVGVSRYVWIPRLGNRAVKTRTGPRIQIDDPAAAEELLDLALQAAGKDQRVIFFCACEWPISEDGLDCHRVTAAGLVLKAAGRRKASLEVVEWPGGEPITVDVDVPLAAARKLLRGARSIPLGSRLPRPELLGLSWGSIVPVAADAASFGVIAGPARYTGGQWCLPVVGPISEIDLSPERLEREARPWRLQRGFEPRNVNVWGGRGRWKW